MIVEIMLSIGCDMLKELLAMVPVILKEKYNMTKTHKFLSALEKGQKVTIKQAVKRFGFNSKNTLTGTVSHLRDAGFDIRGAYVRTANGRETFKYFMAA